MAFTKQGFGVLAGGKAARQHPKIFIYHRRNYELDSDSHHLSKLAEVGLVTARAEGYYSVYQLDKQPLEATARSLFSAEQIAAVVKDVDLEVYDRKVLANFGLPDGSLKEIPAQRKKLEVVLRYVVKAFQPDVKYTEKQVNEILSRFHEDTATLRRELVGYGLMKRVDGGGKYWVERNKV